MRLELRERDRDGADDVTGLVLLLRSEVDDDGVTCTNPFEQFRPTDCRDLFAHVSAGGPLGVAKPPGRDGTDRREQLVDIVSGQSIENPDPNPARHHETRAPQLLEMRGRQADGDGSPPRQDLDAPLALGEEIEHLDAVRVGERAPDPGELRVELVLRRAIEGDPVRSFRSHRVASRLRQGTDVAILRFLGMCAQEDRDRGDMRRGLARRQGRAAMKTLLILNEPAYGNERTYNGLRLALALAKAEGVESRVFLMGDAVTAAKPGQKTPEGYYNLERMLKGLAPKGIAIGACGTCIDARGMTDEPLVEGVRRSTMAELTTWTIWADKVITF